MGRYCIYQLPYCPGKMVELSQREVVTIQIGLPVDRSIDLTEKSLSYHFADELKGLLNLPANLVLGLTIAFGFIGGLVMIGAGSFLIWRA